VLGLEAHQVPITGIEGCFAQESAGRGKALEGDVQRTD
jgi:hypothetical protein